MIPIQPLTISDPARAFCLVALLGVAGCMGGPGVLEYRQGVAFSGWNRGQFEIAYWARDANNPQLCPIVIHLPDADLDEKKLADRNALKALGWAEENLGNGWTQLKYRRGNLVIWANYELGVLAQLGVNALTSQETAEGILSVNGQKLSLPASEEELVRVLGKPRAAKRRE